MDEMEVVLQSRSINKQDLSQEKLPAQPDGSEEPEEKLTVSERVAKLSQNLTQAVAARTDTGFYKDQEEKSKSPLPVKETDEGTETINVSVAERVAKLGQSLSHAVAARPSVVEKSREPIPQQDEQNIEAEHKELTISDRIDKLGKTLDVKMAPSKARPEQTRQEQPFPEITDEQDEKPLKVSDRLSLFEKKAEEEQKIFDEQAKMYERLSKSNSSNLKTQTSQATDDSTFSPEETPCVPRDIFSTENKEDTKEQSSSRLYTAAEISSLSPQLQRAQLFAQETYEEVPYESAHPFNSGHLEFQTTPSTPDEVEKKMQDDLMDKEKSLSQDTETLKKNLANPELDVDKTSKQLINEAFVKESVKSMKPSEQEAYSRLSSWVKETPELEGSGPGLSKEQIDVAFHRLEAYPQSSMEVEFSTRTPSEIDLEEIAALQAQRDDIAKLASTSKEGQTASSSGTKQDSLDEVASIPASSSTSGAGCESIGGSTEGEGKDNRSSPHGDIEEEYNESISQQIETIVDQKESLASTVTSEFQFISGPCVAADAAMCALSPSSGDEDGKSSEDASHVGVDGIESWVMADGTVKRKFHKTIDVDKVGEESALNLRKGTFPLESDDQSITGSTAEASHDSSSPTLMIGVVGTDVHEKIASISQIESGKKI